MADAGYSWRKATAEDYPRIQEWEKTLRQTANWRGNALQRVVFDDYLNRGQSDQPRHQQYMLLHDGNPVAYARALHLSKDSKRLYAGSYRIEETIYHPDFLPPATGAPQALYALLEDQARQRGAPVMYTELSVGLSPLELRKHTAQAASGDTRSAALLAKDFAEMTGRFAQKIDFEPLGIVRSGGPETETHAPYMRLVKVLDPERAALPPYTREGYHYSASGHWLEKNRSVSEAVTR